MKEPVFATHRIWRLSWKQRLLMLLFAAVYLLACRPWSADGYGKSEYTYGGAAIIVILALLPPRWTLGRVLAGLVVALTAVLAVGRVVTWPN